MSTTTSKWQLCCSQTWDGIWNTPTRKGYPWTPSLSRNLSPPATLVYLSWFLQGLYSGLGSLGRLSLDSISIYLPLEKFRTLGFANEIGAFYPFLSILKLRYSAPFLGFEMCSRWAGVWQIAYTKYYSNYSKNKIIYYYIFINY